MVSLLAFLFKAYIIILIFRLIMTQQELVFNSVGKMVAKVTDPVFFIFGKSKADTDKLIPFIILAMVIFFSIFNGLFSFSFMAGFVLGIKHMLTFLVTFFAFCIVLGSITTQTSGAFPLYFYRLGGLWVKPARKILPIKSNMIVFPAIALLMVSYILVASVVDILISPNADISSLFLINALTSVAAIIKLLYYFAILILVRALLSWVSPDPRNPLVQFIYFTTEPVLSPFKRVVPPIGMFDLSAMVAMIVLMVGYNILMNVITRLY